MEQIISSIKAYMEDNPHVVITNDMIKGAIEIYKELLVKEIKEELNLI